MVQGCDSDALSQVDVATHADGADDGAMNADTGVVANGDVADGIVNTAVRLDDAPPAQPEAPIGWGVHPDAMVYLGAMPTLLVEWSQQPDIPPGTCIALVHDDIVNPSL